MLLLLFALLRSQMTEVGLAASIFHAQPLDRQKPANHMIQREKIRL
jgi:hypothetical protein